MTPPLPLPRAPHGSPKAPAPTGARLRSRPRPIPRVTAVVEYIATGEPIKFYPTLRGARIATTRFNLNAGHTSYQSKPYTPPR
jgi:hypothetical protein